MTKLNLIAFLMTFLVSCAATEINPGADKVLATKQPAPKGCKFLGTVVGEQGGSLTGYWTSNKKLAQGAINDLKNKAQAMGANYVALENTQAGNTGGRYGGGQTDVTHMGNAYKCPEGSF